jgi:hypothetical protein
MDSQCKHAAELILDVIRGDKPLSALKWAALEISPVGECGITVFNRGGFRVEAGLQDIARGFLKYHATPSMLIEWAWLVIGGHGFLDLSDEFDTEPDADILLRALKDAVAEGSYDEQAVAVARRWSGSLDSAP